MKFIFLILAILGAIDGSVQAEGMETNDGITFKVQHRNKYEIMGLPGYHGPLPSRHFSGRPTLSSKLSSFTIFTGSIQIIR